MLETFEHPEPTVRPAAFVAALFAKSGRYLERDRYANLGDAQSFNTKVAGVTFEGRQDIAAGLVPGAPLELRRQPDNAHDPNAIAVFFGSLQVGFVGRRQAAKLAPLIDDDGRRYAAEVIEITGGTRGRSFGINMRVRREDVVAPLRTHLSPDRESLDVRRALIGENVVREAQAKALERIDAGRNTLVVMGTGRGKSFCFQYPAAQRALERSAKTLVFYPLRALANDQFDAMTRRLAPLGLRILLANGAIDARQRTELMSALETGAWDVICATPEFVQYHLERFSSDAARPSLVVIDEGHHLFASKHRPAYVRLASLVAMLGTPQIVTLTATAGDEAFSHLCTELGIEAWVIDATVRENLHLVDARGTLDKQGYLRTALRPPGKALVYCMSRREATNVAAQLRKSFGDEVAFYHAGMPSSERATVEELFRSGALRIVVATSAFGEGIDLPDVRNIVLYHINNHFTEFNQQAGRAGRDGADAWVHLLYNRRDREINDYLLEREAPTLETLRALYRGMKDLAPSGILRMSQDDVARTLALRNVQDRTVAAALGIFADAGLVEIGEDEDGAYARFRDVGTKVDLTRNARFAEGQVERESFELFCSLALEAKIETLEGFVNRPIYPQNVPLLR